MKRRFLRRAVSIPKLVLLLLAALVLELIPDAIRADQVQMQNGDRYSGKVVSLSADTLLLQSDVAGTLRLPRAKIALLTLGTNSAASVVASSAFTNRPTSVPAAAGTNIAPSEISTALRQLGSHTNLIQQVQAQFLSDAGPEANAKFNDLLNGLMSGKLSVNDLRAEAQRAANQMHDARKELGDDAGIMIDAYLAVLDHFLKETAPAPATSTNINRPMNNSSPSAQAH
jgi:hypothetical protein